MKDVHEKAIRLIEGGVIEIEGNWFRLRRFPDYYDDIACWECNLDSICRYEHVDICAECETILHRKCCLELAHNRRIR